MRKDFLKGALGFAALPGGWIFSAPCGGAGGIRPVTLNLAHYNIHHGEPKGGKYDIRRTLAAVEWEKQDLIAMNEVDWKSKRVGRADTPADIRRLTGRHVEFVKAKPYGGGYYGNAVVSKETPLSVERIDLPHGDGKGRAKRALILCEFEKYWFGTAHFDTRGKVANQWKSAEIIRGVVAEKSKTKPVFLTGDWNNEPNSKTLGKMREFMTILSDEKARTYTEFKEKPPANEVCIDYIAVDSAHAGKVSVKSRRVKQGDFTSDHNPVFVTVELAE